MPPMIPHGVPYTSCYCEENVYMLAQHFLTNVRLMAKWEVKVVFISNDNKSVALWKQKAAHPDSNLVVWDYHVVLLLRSHAAVTGSSVDRDVWVYDVDSTLEVPCRFEDYVVQTFRACPEQFMSLFRVVSGQTFLDSFASDRSHMIMAASLSNSELLPKPTPPYPPICSPKAQAMGVQHNLMSHFVSMEPGGFGQVVDRAGLAQLLEWNKIMI